MNDLLEGSITGNSSEANHALTYLQVTFPKQPDRRAKKAEAGSELTSGPAGFWLNVSFPPPSWPGTPRLSPHPPRTLRAQHMNKQGGLCWRGSLQGASAPWPDGKRKAREGTSLAWCCQGRADAPFGKCHICSICLPCRTSAAAMPGQGAGIPPPWLSAGSGDHLEGGSPLGPLLLRPWTTSSPRNPSLLGGQAPFTGLHCLPSHQLQTVEGLCTPCDIAVRVGKHWVIYRTHPSRQPKSCLLQKHGESVPSAAAGVVSLACSTFCHILSTGSIC